MGSLIGIIGLVVAVALVSALAERVGVSAPILLVVAGVAISFVPGVPQVYLYPQLILDVVLPLLLYATAINASLPGLRQALRPIILLAIGLVLFTASIVGFTMYAVVPGLPLAAAFVLGAIVGPTDPISATAIAQRVGLPRRVVTVLEGEGMLNDASSLVIYHVAVAAVVSGSFSVLDAGREFLVATVGGVAIGIGVAWGVGLLHRRIEDSLYGNILSLLTPFLAYVPAEAIGASGFVAVVVAGLFLGYRSPVLFSAATRLQTGAVWRVVSFVLQGVVFLLIGLQLREIIQGIEGHSATSVAVYSLVVIVCVIGARFVWVFPSVYFARLLQGVDGREDFWKYPAVISWAGMRGVVSLSLVFALPLSAGGDPFPQRDLLLFLTFVVIAATLGGQGLTLSSFIRRLTLPPQDPQEDIKQAAEARVEAVSAAKERLDSLLEDRKDVSPKVAELLRERLDRRSDAAEKSLDSGYDQSAFAQYRSLWRELLQTERDAFVRMREEGDLDDEVLQQLQGDLDLEELLLREEQPTKSEEGD